MTTGKDDQAGVAVTHMSSDGTHTPDRGDAGLVAGDVVGEYTIIAKIGEGGFGMVFSAVHPVIGKQVAIKVLNRMFSGDREMVSRFVAEARAVNQIRHK